MPKLMDIRVVVQDEYIGSMINVTGAYGRLQKIFEEAMKDEAKVKRARLSARRGLVTWRMPGHLRSRGSVLTQWQDARPSLSARLSQHNWANSKRSAFLVSRTTGYEAQYPKMSLSSPTLQSSTCLRTTWWANFPTLSQTRCAFLI